MSKTEKAFPYDTFGGRIQHLLNKKHLSRYEFLKRIHGDTVTKDSANRTVHDWESGKHAPDVNTLSKICNVLDCDADYLLCRIDAPTHIIENISNLTGLSVAFIEKLISDKKNFNEPIVWDDSQIHFNTHIGSNPLLKFLEELYDNNALFNALQAYINTDSISNICVGDTEIDVSSTDDVLIDGFPINSQLVKNSYLNQIIDELNQLSRNINKPE